MVLKAGDACFVNEAHKVRGRIVDASSTQVLPVNGRLVEVTSSGATHVFIPDPRKQRKAVATCLDISGMKICSSDFYNESGRCLLTEGDDRIPLHDMDCYAFFATVEYLGCELFGAIRVVSNHCQSKDVQQHQCSFVAGLAMLTDILNRPETRRGESNISTSELPDGRNLSYIDLLQFINDPIKITYVPRILRTLQVDFGPGLARAEHHVQLLGRLMELTT